MAVVTRQVWTGGVDRRRMGGRRCLGDVLGKGIRIGLIATREMSAIAGEEVAGSPQTRSCLVRMPRCPEMAIFRLTLTAKCQEMWDSSSFGGESEVGWAVVLT
jgi:hypothetical protein